MTLREMLKLWRSRTDDVAAPYLWSDADGVAFANDAEREACERASLLDDTSPDGPVNNIDGTTEGTYDLDERIIEVRSVSWAGHFLAPVDRATLNDRAKLAEFGSYFEWRDIHIANDWSTLTGTPRFWMVERDKLTLVRKPTVAAPIRLSVYRYPLEPMSVADLDGSPEIKARYHLHLIDWMEYLAYDNVDADKGDPERAKKKEAAFTARFGPRHDADTQRTRIAKRSNQVRMNPDW